MISTTKQITKYWILFALALLSVSNPTWSQDQLEANSIVRLEGVGPNFIIVRDTRYQTLSTVKVFLLNNRPGRMEHLKKGDLIDFTVQKIGKVKYADMIRLVPDQ